MKRLIISLLLISGLLASYSHPTHLHLFDSEGQSNEIELSDGLSFCFRDSSIVIDDTVSGVRYEIPHINKVSYGVVTSAPVLNVGNTFSFTPEGIEISAEGENLITVYAANGVSLDRIPFTDSILLTSSDLPKGLLVLTIDGLNSIKLLVR